MKRCGSATTGVLDPPLRGIAAAMPPSLADLDGIAGIGQKKRVAYGAEVLRIVSAFA